MTGANYVLGLNAYHGDSAACLIRNGSIVAAAEEERFRRIKHWAGFPSEAIRYCLAEAGISISDIEIVAINSDPRASLLKKVRFALQQRPEILMVVNRLRNQARRQSIQRELSAAFPGETFRGRVLRVEHHLAHLASAFLVSPFREAAVLSVDGFGDFASTAWGVGRDVKIDIDQRIYFPHSLGVFYQALTQYLGFPNYGDEYKVMGLAPYGRPEMLSEIRQILKLKEAGRFELDLRFFRHHREKIDYVWEGDCPHFSAVYSDALVELLGRPRGKHEPLEHKHRDIARSVQVIYEETLFHIINHLYSEYQLESLVLAGGCAMNSVANGKILRRSPFKRIYIQSAAGDAGGAIGAAVHVAHQLNGPTRTAYRSVTPASVLSGDLIVGRAVMDHAYFGPAASDAEIKTLLSERIRDIEASGCKFEKIADQGDLYQRTAESISRGEVVGWFQGRMEWGPRALGNRSIVCDPRRANMKDILNQKIKRRENFRPFAPSILKEHVSEWFEEDGDVPFMMQVYQIRDDKREKIPAVTHVDGSGRLQTVFKQTNERYWNLIEAFRLMTGVPMVLNTSFNENEPIVCRPVEALDCFLRTQMDVLVLNDYYISRKTD
jgi:carbamoyltransferase